MRRILASLTLALALAAPAAADGDRFYFVMADRFANGAAANDHGGLEPRKEVSGFDPAGKGWYHGGDLQGMLGRLDYIQSLGTTAIWLTPSFKNKAVQPQDGSAGYHGYWITDFTRIDPHLGTNEDLRRLVDAAHGRGMKVYFDIITNHTADVIGYEGSQRRGYVSKDETPYRDASGAPFDDRDWAGTASFPALNPATSFPYRPVLAEADRDLKVPAWLNDTSLYHNRGDTTFVGENALYGDFFGLDDLFTEHPRVVRGMIDVYKTWISDLGIDGFRIDTMKHVDDAFWQRFAPEVLEHARDEGKDEFLMFGEVFDTSRPATSHFTTRGRVQAVLDFPFQAAAQGFAAASRPTEELRQLFVGDDWYTDHDSDASNLPTFLGNHDMGRIGHFVRQANPGAGDAELLARTRLAHELMYLSRGQPVVYYGDEQGFVGDGGDQDARQDMFASQVASYNDDDLIGTDATTADENFDVRHPLFRAIAGLSALRDRIPALDTGLQQHRVSEGRAGVYAFSRLDRHDRREVVVALNNAEQARSVVVPTWTTRGHFRPLHGAAPAKLRPDRSGRLALTVPPLSAVVLRADAKVTKAKAVPGVTLEAPAEGRDRLPVTATTTGGGPLEVAFQASVGGGAWRPIGTDASAPYRVFHDVGELATGTAVRYRAMVRDLDGRGSASAVEASRVAAPLVELATPADGSRVRGPLTIQATVTPERASHVVDVQRRVGEGAWTTVGTDSSSPVYTAVDDLAGVAGGTRVSYRAVLRGGEPSAARTVTVVADRVTTAVVHYRRPAGDYADWGLHLWGEAIADGVGTAWDAPRQRDGIDAFGAVFRLALRDDSKAVNFIVHRPSGDSVPETREPGGDRSFVPIDSPEVWLCAGDPTIHKAPPSC